MIVDSSRCTLVCRPQARMNLAWAMPRLLIFAIILRSILVLPGTLNSPHFLLHKVKNPNPPNFLLISMQAFDLHHFLTLSYNFPLPTFIIIYPEILFLDTKKSC